MKTLKTTSTHLIIITLVIIFIISSAIFSIGCSTHTYSDRIGNIEYSFQYRCDDKVNPYNPLFHDPWSSGNMETESHTTIEVEVVGLENNPNAQVIQNFIDFYVNNPNIFNFKTQNITIGQIGGISAEGVRYFYSGYTSISVPYVGIFLTFRYKNYVFQVDFLYPGWYEDTDEAFNLFKDTFTVNEIQPQ